MTGRNIMEMSAVLFAGWRHKKYQQQNLRWSQVTSLEVFPPPGEILVPTLLSTMMELPGQASPEGFQVSKRWQDLSLSELTNGSRTWDREACQVWLWSQSHDAGEERIDKMRAKHLLKHLWLYVYCNQRHKQLGQDNCWGSLLLLLLSSGCFPVGWFGNSEISSANLYHQISAIPAVALGFGLLGFFGLFCLFGWFELGFSVLA